jgi:hypothetical protein
VIFLVVKQVVCSVVALLAEYYHMCPDSLEKGCVFLPFWSPREGMKSMMSLPCSIPLLIYLYISLTHNDCIYLQEIFNQMIFNYLSTVCDGQMRITAIFDTSFSPVGNIQQPCIHYFNYAINCFQSQVPFLLKNIRSYSPCLTMTGPFICQPSSLYPAPMIPLQ